jgi:sialate O-acetylesterase
MTRQPYPIPTLLLLAFAAFVSHSLRAEVKPNPLFCNGAVLQREQPVPVWGRAEPGEVVTVEFAGQKKTGTADAEGKWLVKLDPMPASAEGRDLVFESNLNEGKSKVSDVLVGDVWLCSGQSNMHMKMSKVANSQAEIAAAEHPAIRFFQVEEQFGQHPMDDAKGKWKLVSPATAAECSAVAYYFARDLQRKVAVPIGLVVSSVGGTRIETWMRPQALVATGEARTLLDRWKDVSPENFENIATAYRAYRNNQDQVYPQAVKAAKATGAPLPPQPQVPKQRCHDCPGALHNGMIAPLQPFSIRGAIWYQGEANSGQSAAYEKLLPAMIADWRRVWGAELPFLFVQLPPYRATHPAFREAQYRIWQKTPRTAMVVTTDVGDANDIHPTRKRPVGERLALAALALSYGERLEYSGPIFKSMTTKSDRAVISFNHTGTGLKETAGELKGFTLAGADGKFLPARAMIDGSTVVVTSETISKPVAVRYGWAMVPDGNLFNREGLPAAPFRTDQPAK